MEEESEMMPAEGKLHDIYGFKDLQMCRQLIKAIYEAYLGLNLNVNRVSLFDLL